MDEEIHDMIAEHVEPVEMIIERERQNPDKACRGEIPDGFQTRHVKRETRRAAEIANSGIFSDIEEIVEVKGTVEAVCIGDKTKRRDQKNVRFTVHICFSQRRKRSKNMEI